MKTVYSILFSLFWLCLPLPLAAQYFHLELQDIHHSSLEWSNSPTFFEANHLRGEVKFEVSYENDCKEKYEIIWTFMQDMSKLNIENGRTRDLNYVSLIVPLSRTCPAAKKSKVAKYDIKVLSKKLSQKELSKLGLKEQTINESVSFKALRSKRKPRINKNTSKGIPSPFQLVTNEASTNQFCYLRILISGPNEEGIERGFKEEVVYVYKVKAGRIIEEKLPPATWTPGKKKKSGK